MSRDRRDQRGGHRTRMGKRTKNFCCDYCYRVAGITPYLVKYMSTEEALRDQEEYDPDIEAPVSR